MSLIRNLSESLENKYDLNEAFDESMPKWLKKALSGTSPHTAHRKRKGITNDFYSSSTIDYNRIGVGKEYPYTDYQQQRGSHDPNTYLGERFLAMGIDISKMKVIQAPMPTKVPKNPTDIIPIFLFGNGQVWAIGINDREKYMEDSNGRPFFHLPQKTVLNDAVDYCYVELDDPAVKDKPVGDIRVDREQLKHELIELEDYFRNTSGWRVDKSGYNKPNLKNKYADELNKLKAKKIPERFQKVCDRAQALSEVLLDVSTNVNVLDDDNSLSTVVSVVRELKEISNYISTAKNALEYFYSHPEDSYYIRSTSNSIENAEDKVERIEKFFDASGWSKSIVDW